MLKCMEEDRLYPPRFTISITGTSAHETAILLLKFSGSVDDFTTEVTLELNQGTLYIILAMC